MRYVCVDISIGSLCRVWAELSIRSDITTAVLSIASGFKFPVRARKLSSYHRALPEEEIQDTNLYDIP